MKKIIICLFLIANIGYTYSQKITGKVYDNSTKEPIAEASVYLNGTTYNTQTNSKGEFELIFDKKINTDLIISRVGYNMVSVPNPHDGIPEKIFLTQRTILDEVVIEVPKKRFSRQEMLRMFKGEFLGHSQSARYCKIKNEDDIELTYDYNDERLYAKAENPIVITNKYLGYVINFQLINFYIQYEKNTDQQYFANAVFIYANARLNIIKTICLGTTSFVDTSKNSKNTSKKRKVIYESSRNFFFKNLANNTLKSSKINLYINENMIIPEQYFKIQDTLTTKKISLINKKIADSIPPFEGQRAYGLFHITDKNNKVSSLLLLNDNFLVDHFGNVNHPEQALFSGNIGSQRVGDLLPLDYEP